MEDLIITTIQTHLFWEDADKNLMHLDAKIDAVAEPTDIIVLPEMFTTGFTMNPSKLAEEHEGRGLQWMLKKAKEKNCVLVGSISVKDKEQFYNRLYWASPDGTYLFYDKRHLFQMGGEHQHYAAGSKKLIIDYKGWKICPLICYDLRFPVWSRNRKSQTYDVLIYVANWPEVRSYPWKQLLIARAIENQSYVAGVNRIGEDYNNIRHSGDTGIINPRGEWISTTKAHEDRTETVRLSYDYLQEFRKVFPVMMDADEFDLV
ncbi:MAG: amidohydrolase [Bacteroidetes bacterium]|nr:amidohydrolase [Bacteroidota bacterium]